MHDHNLDDLIIDNIEPKNSKTKSFLTIIALLIVVMIVAIILTRILLKTPDHSDLAFEEDVSEMIAPELKLKERAKTPESKKESTISRIIDNESKAPETLKTGKEETVVLKEKNTEPGLELPVAPEVAKSNGEAALSDLTEDEIKAPLAGKEPAGTKEKDAADIAYWESVQEKRKAEKALEKETTEEVVQKAAPVAERVEPKKVPVASVPKPIRKPTVLKPKPATVATGNFYIQVGAYRQDPGTRFMSVIRNNSYQYTMTQPDAQGLKKVLIGPYQDNASATRALTEIKDRINKRAFIVQR